MQTQHGHITNVCTHECTTVECMSSYLYAPHTRTVHTRSFLPTSLSYLLLYYYQGGVAASGLGCERPRGIRSLEPGVQTAIGHGAEATLARREAPSSKGEQIIGKK